MPLIIRIPEKFKHLFPAKKSGSKIDRLVSFVDLAPTLLSIAGINIPDYYQGNAFLGSQKTEDPEYAFMFRGRMDERYDMSRAVRDSKYRYIRNYMPHRIYAQHLEYLWRAPSTRSWEQAYLSGNCNETQSVFWNSKPAEELYDTENDPWEVNNLATDPDYADIVNRMRTANREWMTRVKDAGFIPEADRVRRTGEMPVYDYIRTSGFDLETVIKAAETASFGNAENLTLFQSYLKNEESSIRYWGATGLLILGDKAEPAKKELLISLNDSSPDVVSVAAEALYNLGETEAAKAALLEVLENPNEFARCQALNVIDCIEENSPEIIGGVINMINQHIKLNRNSYDLRLAKWLMEKWKLNPNDYNFNW